VTQTQQLPAYAQPYAEDLLARASALSNTPYTPYTGQQIAGLNADDRAGLGMTESQAINGFQGQQDAMNAYQSTVRGDYLNPASNPYLQGMVNTANNNITNAYQTGTAAQTDAAAARAGAFGGSAYNQTVQGNQKTLADSLASADNGIYGQNYTNERTNQLNAMQLAPQMQSMGYTDAQKILGVGDIQRSMTQDQLNNQYSNWLAQQNQPYAGLDVLMKGLGGSVGNSGVSTQTSATPYQASPFASMLGGIAGAAVPAGISAATGLLFK
jgi:hypothetical protein